MKKLAAVLLAITMFAGFVPANAATVQIDDNLVSPIAVMTPGGEYIIYLDGVQTEAGFGVSLKAYNLKTGATTEFAPNCLANFGTDATYLASDKYFCYLDQRSTSSRENAIYCWPIGSSEAKPLVSRKAPVLRMAVAGSTLAWVEADNGMCIYTKSIEDNSEPVLVAKLDTWSGQDAAMYAILNNNDACVLYEDRSNASSAIRLYNARTAETTTIAETEYAEYAPRYQAGKVFYIKSRSLDPYFQSIPSGGTIECYTIGDKTTSTVYSFEASLMVDLVSNMRNSSSFIFTSTDRISGVMSCKRYDIASGSVFDAFSSTESFVFIQPESCNGSVIAYSKFAGPAKSVLLARDMISGKDYKVSDAEGSQILTGYGDSRFFFANLEFAQGPNPRGMNVQNIRLSAWTIGQ